MADKQPNQYTEKAAIAAADWILIQDGASGVVKKVSASNAVAPGAVKTARLAENAVTPSKMSDIKLFGVGQPYSGSPPSAGTGAFKMQASSSIATTNANGDATIIFPTPFPTALLTVVAVDGDDFGNPTLSVVASSTDRTAFSFSSSKAGGTVRVNWIAIGF